MSTANYSLHKLDFFELNITKVCDLPCSSSLVCSHNSISFLDVINKIVEVENDTIAACVARNPNMTPWTCGIGDIYVTDVKWVKELDEDVQDSPNEHLYKQALAFIESNEILASFGVDADETDTYLLVVEYTED